MRPCGTSHRFTDTSKATVFVFVATIFERYLSIFQTDAPMIPFMFSELEKIYTKLLRLVFRTNCLEETFITKRLNRDWLENLEDGLVDIGVAAKLKLQESKVKAEAKRKFRGKCKRFIINVFIKISERSPMQFSNVRNSISLDPISMVRHPEELSQRFTKLADRLFALKKIAANIADKAKSQYDDLLKVACFNQKDKCLDFKVKSDRLEVFLVGLLPEKFYSELLKVSKIIFIISHGQNFTERGFSINKEVNDCNMQEKSLTC